jgi:hypothetical protein
MRYDGGADHVLTFVNQSLAEELFDVLNIEFVDDLGQNSKSIGLEHVVIRQLNILGEATNDNENFVFTNIELLLRKKSCQTTK